MIQLHLYRTQGDLIHRDWSPVVGAKSPFLLTLKTCISLLCQQLLVDLMFKRCDILD